MGIMRRQWRWHREAGIRAVIGYARPMRRGQGSLPWLMARDSFSMIDLNKIAKSGSRNVLSAKGGDGAALR